LAHAAERDAGEAIFANTRGELCEGTGSNVFVVIDDELVTPPLASGCLAGVNRELLLEVLGPRCVERTVPLDALRDASEAFLTSTGREVQPIRRVDGVPLASCPGPFTELARSAWLASYGPGTDPDP
jgi:branched-chain amino acid aminotransferase